MRPQQPDIQYCIEHREFVNGLLEKRGGWQVGDWCWNTGELALVLGWNRWFPCDDEMLPFSVHREHQGEWSPETYHAYYMIWLPTEGDVLAMLEAQDVTPELLSLKLTSLGGNVVVWFATNAVIMVPDAGHCHDTPLIALLELLRVVHG